MARRRTISRAIIVLVALLLAAIVAVVASIGSQGFTNKNVKSWFNGWGNPDNVGYAGDSISIDTYALTVDEYAAYGISEEAIDAGVITAQYQPDNTTNRRTDWTYDFAGNEWSEGKVLSDYVLFTAGANYAPELTYEVLQPFGDTIVVGATSRANSELKATTNVDFLAQYSAIFDNGNFDIGYHEDLDIFSDLYADDCYSVVPDAFNATVKMTINANFNNWLMETYGDRDDAGWGPYQNVTGAISYDEWFRQNINTISEARIAQYFTQVNPGAFFAVVSVTVTCYYKGEEMYTFTDNEDMCFSSEALELMSVPPTSVSTPDQIVVNPGA